MFNALKYTQELERAGFTREQSEVSLKLIIDIMNENFATRADLKELELTLTNRTDSLELKIDARLKELEYKLIIKLGTMMTVAIGIAATLTKLLPESGH